jgi:type I restriction enzyme S subunit
VELPDELVCSTGFVVLTPRNGTTPKFVSYLAQSNPFTDRVTADSVGVAYPGISETRLGSFHVAIPPHPEQSAIVRYLDYVDRRIRKYIRVKQKLIGLLNEQKQAIIHKAVTRGLDPNVKLKPSGVPWLGDVPEHWEVRRVKQCAYWISKGTTPSTEGREIIASGPVRFIKAENVSGGRIVDKPRCFIDEQTNELLRRSQLREHDVLFVIAGATLGKTAVVHSEHLPANTNQAVAFIRPNRRVHHDFLSLWLRSPRIKEHIWLNAVQSAQPNLSMADLGNFAIPVPPLPEQRQILYEVIKKVATPDEGIDRAQRGIVLLREYRTRLVADVVTGKLDVREVAAGLPEEAGTTVSADEIEAGVDDIEDSVGEAEAVDAEADL